ncbi:MAG: 4-vinyl reductase [Candidatus Micrarchaeota archaeon]|nr:4-vinyl reductase [Candidatus Micrarchaeota archaeon]
MAAKRKGSARKPAQRRSAKPKAQRVYSSLEEILAHRIVSRQVSSRVHEESAILASILSSASPSMRKISYRSGIRVGRLVYAISKGQSKQHAWEYQYLGRLVDFFRNIGYPNTTYSVLPNMLIIDVKRSRANLGANLHVFEAGIISGFLTAATGRQVNAAEESCCYNGSDSCRFVTSGAQQKESSDEGVVMSGFGALVAKNAVNVSGRRRVAPIAEEYQQLSLSHHMHREVVKSSSYLSLIAGSLIGANLFKHYREIPLKGNGEALGAVSKAIELMGLGSPKLMKTGPYCIKVGFSRSNSRREFVEIANSLISGMLSEYPKASFTSKESIEDGKYQLEFTKA